MLAFVIAIVMLSPDFDLCLQKELCRLVEMRRSRGFGGVSFPAGVFDLLLFLLLQFGVSLQFCFFKLVYIVLLAFVLVCI